jgi:hypothetical protein
VLSGAVEAGRCAVVGLVYSLVEGSVRLVDVLGDVGELGGVGAAGGERHDVTHG